MRIHGTTRLRPAEVFATDELPQLKPVPRRAFDIPTWSRSRRRGPLLIGPQYIAPATVRPDPMITWAVPLNML